MPEQMIPLAVAAKQIGRDVRTLQRWLEADCGLVFKRLGQGATSLIRLSDFEAVVAARSPVKKYPSTA